MTPDYARSRGFSLLELSVAMTILAAIVLGLGSIMMLGARGLQDGQSSAVDARDRGHARGHGLKPERKPPDDLVVVDDVGVKVTPPQRPRDQANIFTFMGSSSSSERPTQHIAKKVAQDIVQTTKKGGKDT